MTMYVSHARTPEELQAEVCSDIRRRIELLGHYSETVSKSAAERAKLATAIIEFKAMLNYWQSVEIVRPKRRRKGMSDSVTLPSISSATQRN